jgi:uncharacterized protein
MDDNSQKHPHGPMRRKERQITERAEIDEIIRGQRVMRLALCDDNIPFIAPVFYAYDGQALFFHSSHAGTKMGVLKKNNTVCFEISEDHGVAEGEKACDFEARHRTVIGLGKAEVIKDEAHKKMALDMIVARFTDRTFDYPKADFNRTAVVRIDIESVKGKKHGV